MIGPQLFGTIARRLFFIGLDGEDQTRERAMKSIIRLTSITLWISSLVLVILSSLPAIAGGADVIDASAMRDSNGRYTVTATIQHDDKDWKHYVNRFEVVSPEGKVLGTRYIGHPHVHEQPFTRSAMSVRVPEGVREVRIRAHDKLHGFSGKEFILKLPE